LQALKAIADKHQLILIEDCAQAWGARYRGRPIGSVGQLACYSLNDFKHIGCGDGGIVAANDPRFGPLLQKFGDKAYDRTSVTRLPEFLAPNYRISEPQSAVAAVQLTRLPAIVAKRARLGRLLTRRLAGVGGIHPPRVDGADLCSFWFYMLRLDLRRLGCDRKEFVAALNAEGVPARAGYIDAPLYQYPVFQNCNFFAGRWPLREAGLTSMDYRKVACPVAEEILASSVIFPLNQAMDAAYITGVAAALRKVAQYFSNRSNISAKAGQV
jgi:dTDP-4-amino-4,6-dideoxygalactose transaminase